MNAAFEVIQQKEYLIMFVFIQLGNSRCLIVLGGSFVKWLGAGSWVCTCVKIAEALELYIEDQIKLN